MKSKTTPIIIALAIPIVSVALAIALIYFKKRNVSGLDEFPYAAYSASPESLRGNRYVLEAQMDVQLANVEGGRVVAALGGREGFPVAAAKTGMLFSAPIIRAVAGALRERDFPLVVDPVCVSQSGSRLLQEDAVEALKQDLLPLCDLLTPNRPEAEALTGLPIADKAGVLAAGEALLRMGPRAVLIKGGHMEKDSVVTDYLFMVGEAPRSLAQPRVETPNNHGTGCTLSAAIATNLGKGLSLPAAVSKGFQEGAV